ncbi:MAG TPA: cyclomaltodextrin glucanotransferase, partial [Aeromonadales bacterium]|nr:cyclomaltodextrin glucanotransferase [Aeromonadales bacterium]
MKIVCILMAISLVGCKENSTQKNKPQPLKEISQKFSEQIYGTKLPFASEAVYFLMTDRFVNGDTSNDQINQGGNNHTFNRPLHGPDGQSANVGYLGGDFKGILNNAQYIADMGFTAVWLSPIVDNPDEAFTGGEPIEFGGAFKDGGKTGYHGYWGDNFFKVDEHWPSADLSFQQLTHKLRAEYGLKTVLDIVLNHGSPAFSMKPVDQPKFGEIYDENWKLIADQQNLPAEKLDANNPLHQFYNHKTEIVQLSDINENNPKVLEYFVRAYLHWIDEGADAFRIDTLKHMPHSFWKKFADKIREKHPDFFMFGESYSYDASFIAQHTFAKNGSISVLDFPGQKAITAVFENPASDYADIQSYLHLKDKLYNNPYELMTFYDNHDMQRMNASENGFIDANNWLFTSRGI